MTQQASIITRLVLKSGVVKTEKRASYVLLGFALILLAISVFLIADFFPKKQKIIKYERYEDLPADIRAEVSRELFESYRPSK